MVDFLKSVDSHLDEIDKAIETHKLTDVLEVHSNARAIKAGSANQDIDKTSINLSDADKRKKQILKELEKELLFLGLKEGQGMETRDISLKSDDVDYRGILSKRLKSGLVMEYTFSSQAQHIKNFHLNNVEIDLASIPEDKLLKLFIITKFFNSIYRIKKIDNKEEKLSLEEEEKLRKEREEERRRQMILGKL